MVNEVFRWIAVMAMQEAYGLPLWIVAIANVCLAGAIAAMILALLSIVDKRKKQ